MQKIRVLTYNLLFNKALPHLKLLIQEVSPDLVGLQEVDFQEEVLNDLEKLGYKLGAKAISFTKFGKKYSILTLYKTTSLNLSKFNYLNLPRNIYEKVLHLLKKSPFPRSFTTSYFSKNNTDFLHLNVHLSPWSTDGAKVKQIKKLFDSVKNTSLPTIITGDFNFPYGKRRFEYLLKQYDLKEATANLTFTQETKLFKLIPIRLKLDYILYKNLKHIKTQKLPKNSSDHYPILAEFEL